MWKDKMSEQEKEHARILEKLAVLCRSDTVGFTNTDRLRAIGEELKGTPYSEIHNEQGYECRNYSLWSKAPLKDLPENIVVVSTHCDTVSAISKCSSALTENGYYSGTYDNQGTNAAAVILMKESSLPDNVVFTFDGEEETGRCTGVKQVTRMLKAAGKNVIGVALDVTYEGFDDNRLASLENLTTGPYDKSFLNFIGNCMLQTEPEESQSFCFVKAAKNLVPEVFDSKFVEPSTGMYDEGFAYRDEHVPGMSLCLPCDGNMHSNTGVKVKQPVFEGYVLSLESLLYSITRGYNHNEELTTKLQKTDLVHRAEEIEFEKKPVFSNPNFKMPASSYFQNRYDEYDDDEELEDDDDFDYDDEEDENNYEVDEEGMSSKPWYIESLSDMVPDLCGEAMMFDDDDISGFVDAEISGIAHAYMEYITGEPGTTPSDEVMTAVAGFLEGIYCEVHGIDNEEEYEYSDEDFEQE